MNKRRWITLEVGGQSFKTTENTLQNHQCFFTCLLQNENCQEEPTFRIDRDPTHFRHILNYMRDGVDCILPNNDQSLKEIAKEAKFYGLYGLVELCEKNAGGVIILGFYYSSILIEDSFIRLSGTDNELVDITTKKHTKEGKNKIDIEDFFGIVSDLLEHGYKIRTATVRQDLISPGAIVYRYIFYKD